MDDERHGCFVAVSVTAFLCVSTFLAWRELQYLIRGDTVDARIVRVYDVPGGYRRRPARAVSYEFVDPETHASRAHTDHMPLSWTPPPGALPVEFISGADTYTRVAGHDQQWALWVFGASLVALIGYIGVLAREANTPIRRPPPRKDLFDDLN